MIESCIALTSAMISRQSATTHDTLHPICIARWAESRDSSVSVSSTSTSPANAKPARSAACVPTV